MPNARRFSLSTLDLLILESRLSGPLYGYGILLPHRTDFAGERC